MGCTLYTVIGCDAHIHVEYNKNAIRARKIENITGFVNEDVSQAWVEFTPKMPNPYHDPNRSYSEPETSDDSYIYDGRNYKLFGKLGLTSRQRVGDSYVTPGVKEGLPDDLSPTVREDAELWYGDGHSHGYVMLQAILDDKEDFLDVDESFYNCAVKIANHFNMLNPAKDIRLVYWFDN